MRKEILSAPATFPKLATVDRSACSSRSEAQTVSQHHGNVVVGKQAEVAILASPGLGSIAKAAEAEREGVGPEDARTAGSASAAGAEVMTVEELARELRVRPKTVYAAIRHDQIPGVLRVGRLIRISRLAVVAWVAGQARGGRSRRSP